LAGTGASLTIDSIRARREQIIGIVLVFLLFLPIAGCERHANRIVVGSKNFTEQLILGELFAQIIEARTHLPVERRFYLAGTFICQQAILAGRIDVYPEYTGTALTAVLRQQTNKDRSSGDKQEIYRRVQQDYKAKFGLSVGPPLGFDDTFAMVIRGDDARHLQLKTLSQAANLRHSGAPVSDTNSWSVPMDTKGSSPATDFVLPERRASWIWDCCRGPLKSGRWI